MNTPERNVKNALKMQEVGRVYEENDEDKVREISSVKENPALEKATREYPLPTARRFAWILCGGLWLFCLGGMLFRIDMSILLPFLLFSLAIAVGLQIPVFYLKRKIPDVIMASIFALGCIGFGLTMLVG